MRANFKIFLTVFVLIFSTSGFVQTVPDNTSGKLRIAACQFPISGNIPENAEWIREQMQDAQSKGAKIIHFPECALSGYWGVDFPPSQTPDWKVLRTETKKILRLADKLNVWVILGSSHALDDELKPHNSLYIIDPHGNIVDRYDKRFCTTGDLKYYSPGDHFVTFKINDIKCGVLICYDVRFPELFREYRKLGVDLIFHSFHNARKKEGNILPIIIPVTAQARAATNYFYMSLTNSSAAMSWPSHFIKPDGIVANKLEADKPGILVSDIDLSESYKDASRPFRNEAIDGKLNSGDTVNHIRSQDRTVY